MPAASGFGGLLALAALQLLLLNIDTPLVRGGEGNGVRNLLVVVVLPALMAALASRLSPAGRRLPRSAAAYVALVGWALLATIWSPYPVAALKAVGYLSSFGLLFVAYRKASLLEPGLPVLAALWLAGSGIVVALLQTLVFGNSFGALAHRFTSFVGPQSFGLTLAVLFGTLLYAARGGLLGTGPALAMLAPIAVASLMNGGRQGFLTVFLLGLVAALPDSGPRAAGSGTWARAALLPVATVILAIGLATGLKTAGPPLVRQLLDEHSAIGLLLFSSDKLAESGDAGTFRDRLKIYAALTRRIADSSPAEMLLGHGTSSSAVVIAQHDVEYRHYDSDTMDPNRTAHNELLRSLHDWGLLGFLLLAVVIGVPLLEAWRVAARTGSGADRILLATAVIGLLGYSVFGNTLAASSGPLGAALVLVCVEVQRRSEEEPA